MSSNLSDFLPPVNELTIGTVVWTVIDANSAQFTVPDGQGVFADTSLGTFDVTLPLNPIKGSQCNFSDPSGNWSTTSFHILGNGQNIMGAADFFDINVSWHGFKLVHDGTEWRLS